MILPIASNVFTDGELTTEASWYARIFTPINTIYATLVASPRGRLNGGANTAGTGNVSTETMLSGMSQVAFTLASTRRVMCWFTGSMLAGSGAGTSGRLTLRRNSTGAAVTTSDTRVSLAGTPVNTAVTGVMTAAGVSTELLAAGTYAYGLSLLGTSGTVQLTAAADFPTILEVFDMGST